MIREIAKHDLTDEYFMLLSQLSGGLSGYSVYNMWESYLKGSSKTFVYVDENNEIIGSATIFIEYKFLHCGSTVSHIEDVVVDENSRRKGVGKALIEKCNQVAEEHGCYKVILDCSIENIPFYAKSRFIPDAYCMRKDLKKRKKRIREDKS